jgi:hypothetical protein
MGEKIFCKKRENGFERAFSGIIPPEKLIADR